MLKVLIIFILNPGVDGVVSDVFPDLTESNAAFRLLA